MSDSGYDSGVVDEFDDNEPQPVSDEDSKHAKDDNESSKDDDESSKDDDESDDEEDESDDEEGEDVWVDILAAAKLEYGESSDNIFVEPYLSQFVEHVKNYVEERTQFVRDVEFDEFYEKINKAIEKYVSKGYDRKEAVDSAWNDRRFLVKQIMEKHRDTPDD